MWNWQMTESNTGLFQIQNSTCALNFSRCSSAIGLFAECLYCHFLWKLHLILHISIVLCWKVASALFNWINIQYISSSLVKKVIQTTEKYHSPPHLYDPVYNILFLGNSLHVQTCAPLALWHHLSLCPLHMHTAHTHFNGPVFVGKTQNKFELHRSLF